MRQPAFLTVAEAAQLLRVGRSAAYEAVRTGQLPSVRVGRNIRIPRAALVAQDTETAGAPTPAARLEVGNDGSPTLIR